MEENKIPTEEASAEVATDTVEETLEEVLASMEEASSDETESKEETQQAKEEKPAKADKKKLKKHPVLFGLKAFLSIYTRIFSRRSASIFSRSSGLSFKSPMDCVPSAYRVTK